MPRAPPFKGTMEGPVRFGGLGPIGVGEGAGGLTMAEVQVIFVLLLSAVSLISQHDGPSSDELGDTS